MAAPQASNSGVLDLKISLNYDGKQQTLGLSAHSSRHVGEILKRVEKWFSAEVIPRERKPETAGPGYFLKDFQLLYQSACLSREQSLAEAGITEDCELEAIYQSSEPGRAVQPDKSQEDGQIDSNGLQVRQLTSGGGDKKNSAAAAECDPNLLPKCPRHGYKTIPTLQELSGMTESQLRRLPKFTVRNAHGSIEFHPRDPERGGVDVTEVDLEDVEILEREVIVYGRFDGNEDEKPALGTKLNVPATITLKKVGPPAGRTAAEWEAVLRKNLARSSTANAETGDDGVAEFLAYDLVSHEWVFRVPHFTKWGLEGDEEKEDSDQQPAQAPRSKEVPRVVDNRAVGTAWIEEEKEDMLEQVETSMKVPDSKKRRSRVPYGSAEQHSKQDAGDFIELSAS